jgi:hypothetical protein
MPLIAPMPPVVTVSFGATRKRESVDAIPLGTRFGRPNRSDPFLKYFPVEIHFVSVKVKRRVKTDCASRRLNHQPRTDMAPN